MLPHSKFKGSFWNRLCVCKDSILGTEEPFVSKLGTVVHCCQPKCLVKKKMFANLQREGQSEVSYTAVFAVQSELLIVLQPNLV